MSSQQFSNFAREALWDVHGRKCFYCRHELSLVDMVVDHVLPESLVGDVSAFSEVKRRLGLEDTFDLLGHENHVPSCHGCNSRKSDLHLADGVLAINLASIKAKVPALKVALETRHQERTLDGIFRTVARSVDAGHFTVPELVRRIQTLQPPPDDTRQDAETAIIWTEHAHERAGERGISAAAVLNAIQKGDPVLAGVGQRGKLYWVQTTPDDSSPGVRVTFAVDREKIIVRTVEWTWA